MYLNAKSICDELSRPQQRDLSVYLLLLHVPRKSGCSHESTEVWVAMDRQMQLMLRALQPFKKGNFY